MHFHDVLFELHALSSCKIPCAGITELPGVANGRLAVKDGRPAAPNLITLNINLIAVIHSKFVVLYLVHFILNFCIAVYLGLHYFKHKKTEGAWKSVVLLGSMGTLLLLKFRTL